MEEYSRHADWISHFELDMLTPLSLEPYSPLRLNDADIENGNLVFLRQARAYQTQDALLAIENGKSYFNYLILSHTKDGWRIAEINSAYPTENLLEIGHRTQRQQPRCRVPTRIWRLLRAIRTPT